MGYLYETHLHTCQGSACGVSRGKDYISRYIDLGFTGIFVTDHFFNSNCKPDRRLPWADWVAEFCSGWEDAKNEGDRLGLDVFFGWEETFDGDDYMVYGLDKKWLLSHPELVRWNRRELRREVNKAGGCVVQAHPFRQHHYLRDIRLMPFLVDAVEAGNMHNRENFYDGAAFEYAQMLGLPAVAGSDIHRADDAEKMMPYGIEVENKFDSASDYAALILGKNKYQLKVPEGRFDLDADDWEKLFNLEVAMYDGDGLPLSDLRKMSLRDVETALKAMGV
jgi:hypothetical protein